MLEPQEIGTEGLVDVEFQRHSRTVIVFALVSIVTNWNDNFVSSVAKKIPFIGESTWKVFNVISLSGL